MNAAASEPVRLGLVIGQLTLGGAEGQLAELVRGLGATFAPTVYSLGSADPTLIARMTASAARVRQIAGSGPLRALRLASAMRADRVQLIHSWLFIANAYAAAARRLGVRAPLITSARNCKVQNRANQIANTIAFRMSAAIVVNSADVEAFIVRHYRAPAGRICIVHNGVDAVRFQPAAKLDGAPTIITIGRMVRQKNHELFLRAAAELVRSHPQCRFVIGGDGPLR
ncbi:MAG TPA: glycosyltransferase, partial [Terriglobales bacterium]|nr:glycosyltransferase [Terriglobales bacterium]